MVHRDGNQVGGNNQKGQQHEELGNGFRHMFASKMPVTHQALPTRPISLRRMSVEATLRMRIITNR